MKFLIDNNLSPQLSIMLKNSGYDSVHVKDYNLQRVPDYEIFLRAYEENRIIISADTDFWFYTFSMGKKFAFYNFIQIFFNRCK